MPPIPNTVQVTGPVAPTKESDEYPTHYDYYGSGGYRSVQTITDRNNISHDRRREGMLCRVINESNVYVLDGGIDDVNWVLWASGILPKNNYIATVNPTSSNDSTQGYSVGSEWLNTSTNHLFKCLQDSPGSALWFNMTIADTDTVEVPFSYLSASPLKLSDILAGQSVANCEVVIEDEFNDPASSLKVGTYADDDLVLPEDHIDPLEQGSYGTEENFLFTVEDDLILTISPGTSTAGSGYVYFQVKRS